MISYYDNYLYKKFDWKIYINNYEDLQNIKTKKAAWEHWVKYGKYENRVFNKIINNTEFINFDWEVYVNTYEDLQNIKTKEKAWEHWINHGKNEKRKINFIENNDENNDENNEINYFENIDLTKNQIIFKNNYIDCEKHLFRWENSINYLIKNNTFYKNNNFDKNNNFKNVYYFDEWIEKLLIWGNKNNYYFNKICKNNLQIITFLHSPPTLNSSSMNNIFINNKVFINETIINLIISKNLLNLITFLYTFSNYHKHYICNKYPFLQNKILSIYYPTDNNETNKLFDINKFIQNKQIYQIGYNLQNFNSFLKFKISNEFTKNILIKEKYYEKIQNIFGDKNINIIQELPNENYIEIFLKSCIFCDMIDCAYSNIILECIKFNTPIILKKIPSHEEYLGKNYPLFFTNENDLLILNDSNLLLNKIKNASLYLKEMNKTHISLNLFNNKMIYDINKLKKNNNQYKLTWLCYLKNETDDIENYISVFNKQSSIENIKLIIINKIKSKIKFLKKYETNNNIKIINIDNFDLTFSNLYNIFIENSDTEYLTFKNVDDLFDSENYSDICINYLEENPTFDIIYFNNESKLQFTKNKKNKKTKEENITTSNNCNEDSKNNDNNDNNDNDNNDNDNENNENNDNDNNDNENNENNENNDNENNDNENNDNDNHDNESDIQCDIESDSESESESEDEVLNINVFEKMLTLKEIINYNYYNNSCINVIWRKSIHDVLNKFQPNFWVKCYENHFNIFEIKYIYKLL